MTNIVTESPDKGNKWPQILIICAIVVLVGVASFGLGRLSAQGGAGQGSIIIHQPGEAQN